MHKCLWTSCLVVLASGCITKSIGSPMRPANAPAIVAPADMARVIVIRPGRMAGKMITHHVVDEDTFLGDAFNDSAFATDLKPGAHQFCVGNSSTGGPLVTATLAAGKTYLLRVDLSMSYPYLTPMKPGTDDLKEAQGELPNTRGAELLGPNAEDAPSAEDVKAIFGRCRQASADSSPQQKTELTVAESDSL